ncbi:murein transglycosylase A [Hyphomicrobium sp. DMF-1]|jgi:membrane-bound lytic murein transglycosylase A|uniref:murein transglycosylase A n=1 Tax=Hyphomicrobium sp. DMF-1 TaxID=3019544 RepID=UPI0022EBBA45|nr:MltA domain-containing protein [Hyphomicrobium sp. DMF-1]WBT38610.1 MltA domain-containing protein [Hyphomicrobium sp. DMF-1]
MPLGAQSSEQALPDLRLVPLRFSDLPGWEADDHLAAFKAFIRSAKAFERPAGVASGKTRTADEALVAAVRRAAARAAGITTAAGARAFFEESFVPHRVERRGAGGVLTGYYEPVLPGSRTRTDAFSIPVYRRPPDLVNLVGEAERGALADGLTHARKTASGIEPYATRAEIEGGALEGQGLELVWLSDPVDTFFMHIQGSGRIRFPDGTTVRITYDGKNGHPYTSVGRHLIDAGQFTADQMSLDALKVWLSADAERGRRVMQENRSFIFFRELENEDDGPLGALEIPLSSGRSLAVDTGFHAIGTPVFVTAPDLKLWGGEEGFARLMIAQDVGSAIRGPERGDIYFGSGTEAGALAGTTKHAGRFFVLLPREQPLP